MKGFRFKRIHNKFRWESNFMCLEFSEPSIQGFSDFTNLKSEKGIMYYYYNVKIFKKINDWDKNEKEIIKWKLLSERWTHDFPCITQLKWILEQQLKDNTTINGQKNKYQNGDVRYSKTMKTEDFACDDFYEITKDVDSENKNDRYIVYCGTTYDYEGDLNSEGIRTPYVNRKDIKELLSCVSSFIQYSLDKHNQGVNNWKNRYEIKNNKIYEYNSDNNVINKNKIESIWNISDIIDITIVINNKEQQFDNLKIKDITSNSIICEDISSRSIIIAFKNIRYISYFPTEIMLRYTEKNIVMDFINVLNDVEKKEFVDFDTEILLDKYKMAIIDRTAMCRDEHNFNIDYTNRTKDRIELVEPIVINVINKIKSKLK